MHSLIYGQTESGKTILTQKLISSIKSQEPNKGVLVLDPLNSEGWLCDYLTTEPRSFLEVYWKSRLCHCVIDESVDSFDDFQKEMIKTATRGRHWGHSNYYLGQRPMVVPKTVRDQCTQLFLFRVSMDDAKNLSKEWGYEDIANAHSLNQGEFYQVTRFGGCKKLKVF